METYIPLLCIGVGEGPDTAVGKDVTDHRKPIDTPLETFFGAPQAAERPGRFGRCSTRGGHAAAEVDELHVVPQVWIANPRYLALSAYAK